MTRTQVLALTAALLASIGAQAAAQSTRMNLLPDSKVTLAGSSNVHDWACRTSAFNATIELDSSYESKPLAAMAKPIVTVVVSVPVKSLKCGKGKMDENMYKALRADQFPDIKYVLETYDVTKELCTDGRFVARTIGNLTVAGTTQKIEIPITATRGMGGAMRGEGTVKMLITDFGIKPPVALLGTLRTKNEIQITFQVLLDKAVVLALTQQK